MDGEGLLLFKNHIIRVIRITIHNPAPDGNVTAILERNVDNSSGGCRETITMATVAQATGHLRVDPIKDIANYNPSQSLSEANGPAGRQQASKLSDFIIEPLDAQNSP